MVATEGFEQPALFLGSLLTARNERTKREYKCCDKHTLALLAWASEVSTSWRAAAESCWTIECLREYPWLQKIQAERPRIASISSLYSQRMRCRFNPYYGWGNGSFGEQQLPGDQEASGYQLVCEMHEYQGSEEEGYGDVNSWGLSTDEYISVFESARSRKDWVQQAFVLQSMWGCDEAEAAAKKRLLAQLEDVSVAPPLWSSMPLDFQVDAQEVSMSSGKPNDPWDMSSHISASTTYELNPNLSEYEQYDDYQRRATFSCPLSHKYSTTPQVALVLYIVRKRDNHIFCLGRQEIDHMKKLSPYGEGPYQSCVMGRAMPLTTNVSFSGSEEDLEVVQFGGVDFVVALDYSCLDGCGFIVVNMTALKVLVNATALSLVPMEASLFQLFSGDTGSTTMKHVVK